MNPCRTTQLTDSDTLIEDNYGGASGVKLWQSGNNWETEGEI